MSLIAWYPLNGDLKNLGVGDMDLGVSSLPTFSAGKTGKAATGGGASLTAALVAKIFTGNTFSVAFWYKATGTTTNAIIGSTGERIFTVFAYPTGNDLYWDWKTNGTGNQVNTGRITGTFPTNEWVHIAITLDGPVLTVYKNGTVISTQTNANINNTTFSSALPILTYNNSGSISDIRLYDHCLSQKEVREISKGLVLHYPLYLTDGYVVGRNLITNVSDTIPQGSDTGAKLTRTGNKITITQANSFHNNYGWLTDKLSSPVATLAATTGSKYTISADFKVENLTSGQFIIEVDFRKSGTSPKYSTPVVVADSSCNGKWIRVYSVLTTSFTDPTKCLLDVTCTNANVGASCEYRNFKFEKGDKPTPFTLAPEDDSSYATTTVRDCSGFGNDGVRNGNVTGVSDSPIGTHSYKFGGTTSDYIAKAGDSLNFTDNFSWSCWIKVASATGYAFVNGRADGSGWGYGLGVTSGAVVFKYANGTTDVPITSGEWTHLAFVAKNGVGYCYKNGEQAATFTPTAMATYSASYGLALGIFAYNESFSKLYPFDGQLADFRIFCTPLSADAIKELYQTRFQAADNGTLFCYEYAEKEGSVGFNANGILQAGGMAEQKYLMDMKTKVLEDGSCWARIFYHNNKAGTKLFSSSDNFYNSAVIIDSDRYSRMYLVDNFKNGSTYEFMVCQPDDGNGVWRWKQTGSPRTSTSAGTVTAVSGYEYDSLGLVKSSGAAFMAHTSTSSNWWCAVGAYTAYQGGIPGWGSKAVKGGLELWVRFDNCPYILEKLQIFSNTVTSREIIEY